MFILMSSQNIFMLYVTTIEQNLHFQRRLMKGISVTFSFLKSNTMLLSLILLLNIRNLVGGCLILIFMFSPRLSCLYLHVMCVHVFFFYIYIIWYSRLYHSALNLPIKIFEQKNIEVKLIINLSRDNDNTMLD